MEPLVQRGHRARKALRELLVRLAQLALKGCRVLLASQEPLAQPVLKVTLAQMVSQGLQGLRAHKVHLV